MFDSPRTGWRFVEREGSLVAIFVEQLGILLLLGLAATRGRAIVVLGLAPAALLALLRCHRRLGVVEHFGELRVALGLQVAEMLEEIGLAEQVLEAANGVGQLAMLETSTTIGQVLFLFVLLLLLERLRFRRRLRLHIHVHSCIIRQFVDFLSFADRRRRRGLNARSGRLQ